ncbi:MAG: hypothetical protein OEY01_16395 [Desulfobulbaceae bacterium]|nr:hypothetical protein [Desulfobulbaceae bacterium]
MSEKEKGKDLLLAVIDLVINLQATLNSLPTISVETAGELQRIQREARQELVRNNQVVSGYRNDAVDGLNGLLSHFRQEKAILGMTEHELRTTLTALEMTAGRLRQYFNALIKHQQGGQVACGG